MLKTFAFVNWTGTVLFDCFASTLFVCAYHVLYPYYIYIVDLFSVQQTFSVVPGTFVHHIKMCHALLKYASVELKLIQNI